MSWPRALGQVPIFFGQRPSGRPMNPDDFFTSKYLDVANDPLYCFGHGLSYGRFAYADLRVTPDRVSPADAIHVQVTITNSGARAAQDTVFLFTRDPVASVARPLLELRGFGKIDLAPGESGVVALSLLASDLKFLGRNLAPVFEAGDVEILVGPCADRAQLLSAVIKLR